jgi:hypothetical protein
MKNCRHVVQMAPVRRLPGDRNYVKKLNSVGTSNVPGGKTEEKT